MTFGRPFLLDRFDAVLPAGAYSVETDEELLEGISFPAYRRVLTVIHLHPDPDHPGLMQTLTIDPNDLDAALKHDQSPEQNPVGREAGQKMLKGTAELRRKEADRRAIERGEDEGMIVRPG
ncbi:MAG: hypothetical protein HY057_13675 [Rhodospirillales bacterium]|nr:hypothetical protein [Rhodospirillales bacterium]